MCASDGTYCPITRQLVARDGAVVRALVSHQRGPGSNPDIDAICGLSLLLVLSFSPRGFSLGTPVFPSPQKHTFPNSNSTMNQVDEEPLCGCATSKSLFIYLFILLQAMTCTVLLHCPTSAEIRTVTRQSDFRILLWLWLIEKDIVRIIQLKHSPFSPRP